MKRRALSLLLLLLALFAVGVPSAFGQSCATPAPTYTPTPGYRATIQAASPGDLLVYYPLNETSGTVAEDDSGNNLDGTYSGVTLNASTFLTGNPAPSFDGVNDRVGFYSATLDAIFNRAEGTVLAWAKVGGGAWTDAAQRIVVHIGDSVNNRLLILKSNASNLFQAIYVAGGTSKSVSQSSFSPAGWFPVVITWSKSADQVKLFLNGVQVGTTQTGLGTWTAALVLQHTNIGIYNSSTNSVPWFGNIAQVAVWDVALNPTTVAQLATIDPTQIIPPTPTLCPSWTPTFTPTWTPTPTPTPTNTPDLYINWTLPAPVGTALPGATGTPTPAPGQWVRFEKTFTAGQAAIALELGILAILIVAALTIWLLTRRQRA